MWNDVADSSESQIKFITKARENREHMHAPDLLAVIGMGHRVSIFELIKLQCSYLCIRYPIRANKHTRI